MNWKRYSQNDLHSFTLEYFYEEENCRNIKDCLILLSQDKSELETIIQLDFKNINEDIEKSRNSC